MKKLMEKLQNNRDLVTLLRTAVPALLLFVVEGVVLLVARGSWWPSNDAQRTTFIYMAFAVSLPPIAAYLVGFLSQSKASVAALLAVPLIFIAGMVVFSRTPGLLGWPSNDAQRTTAIHMAFAVSLLPIAAYLLSLMSRSKGLVAALLAVPLIFIAGIVVFSATPRYFGWPSNEAQRTTAIYMAFAVSLLPVAAHLLSFLSQSRASLTAKGLGAEIAIDFSKNVIPVNEPKFPSDMFQPGTETAQVPRGPGAPPSSKQIVQAISTAIREPVVLVDIKEGTTWPLSRLFALSAGASRFGLTHAIVFVGTKEDDERTFLGWAEPRGILEAIMRDDQGARYKDPYLASAAIGEDTFLQKLVDRLDKLKSQIWVTKDLLSALFGTFWHIEAVDLELPGKDQVKKVLDIQTRYIPLVRKARFDGMTEGQLATKAIVRQLMSL